MKKKKAEEVRENTNLRIGVFICDCGSNIAGHLDCTSVTEYAATLPGVVFTKENLYTCSEAGIAEIQKAIRENNLNRVVVASCSPRTHHPLFSESCSQVGLNPYLFEMVNIRDQCSWVHMGQQDNATAKAKDLVRMGVAKSAGLAPQQDIESTLTRKVLVIGAGMAGLSAADALAGMGLDVILVEKETATGGLLNTIDRLDSGDRAVDRIGVLVEKVAGNPAIELHLAARVTVIGGYIGNYTITVDVGGSTIEDQVGCIVVATGAVPFKPEGLFGYDGKTAITQMELEEHMMAEQQVPDNVVMIQCAGARSQERAYCSRICCTTAVKNALLLKKQNPLGQVSILYRDMQMYGTIKEKMLWEARQAGVRFHVYDEKKPPRVEKGQVVFDHPLLGKEMAIASDLTVLSTPLVPRPESADVAQMMRVPTDQNGFFLEAHAKLRPLDFAADGIFVCGSARYPATVVEAQSQGMGVASRVAAILFKDKLVTSAIVAKIDAGTCVGCLGCLTVCPYEAISFNEEKKVCEVNEILCKGCGNCAATCPSHSAALNGYTSQQLLSQIRAA